MHTSNSYYIAKKEIHYPPSKDLRRKRISLEKTSSQNSDRMRRDFYSISIVYIKKNVWAWHDVVCSRVLRRPFRNNLHISSSLFIAKINEKRRTKKKRRIKTGVARKRTTIEYHEENIADERRRRWTTEKRSFHCMRASLFKYVHIDHDVRAQKQSN